MVLLMKNPQTLNGLLCVGKMTKLVLETGWAVDHPSIDRIPPKQVMLLPPGPTDVMQA